jgi:hypothetical protein
MRIDIDELVKRLLHIVSVFVVFEYHHELVQRHLLR